jgi:hypothetical protein
MPQSLRGLPVGCARACTPATSRHNRMGGLLAAQRFVTNQSRRHARCRLQAMDEDELLEAFSLYCGLGTGKRARNRTERRR